MKKYNKRRSKRIRNLIILCCLSAIVLTVSTYAWFVGMKTVNVSAFDIDIATTEGLTLSMDGENWSYQLDAAGTEAYVNNTNKWLTNDGEGLIPLSSVGDMDSTSSTMKLFEKGSLATTKGGYRLLSSRVHNYDTKDSNNHYIEGDGYVVFDLFIKNLSGTEYYFDNNAANEEDIYLTTNSSVIVSPNGGVANTGIENSVRVAFTQIGRVKADTQNAGNITAITCSNVEAAEGQVRVTGICRDAQIWEPNDKAHVQNAINWYDTSCLPRTGADVTLSSSYTTTESAKCGTVANNTANKTYAISRPITANDMAGAADSRHHVWVDVYDGAQYNSYTANTLTYADYITNRNKAANNDEEAKNALAEAPLVDFPYFTDTMKNLTGTNRPTFMTLAPNSITKLRVYIWLEGQDVDNYDFASLGAKIRVNFGFTKERYTETDIGYTGPDTNVTEPTPNPETPVESEGA